MTPDHDDDRLRDLAEGEGEQESIGSIFKDAREQRAGKAMRAVADNPDLARLKGISVEKVALLATFAGMGLAGAGGMLLALETSVDPLVGSRILLMVFAASVVGGLTSIPGAVAGALIIGVAQELSLLVITPTYSSAVGFVAIALTLTLRPQGLFGRKS